MGRKKSETELPEIATSRKVTEAEPLEDVDLEEEAPQRDVRTKFHLFGAVCFVISFLAAVFCVLLSTLIYSKIPFGSLRVAFFATFASFLVFLFFCLCCTYYMGVDKAWDYEKKNFQAIRISFSNILTLSGTFIEFLQVVSFSYNPTIEYFGLSGFLNLKYLATPIPPEHQYFEIAFWVMFGFAFLPYILVVLVRVIVHCISSRSKKDSSSFITSFQGNFHLILWFLVNTLYFPVITTLIFGVDCTFKTDGVTLDANPTIQCLTGHHIGLLIATIIGLMGYYPAASFAQTQTQVSDVKFKPRVVFIMLQAKFVLSFIRVFTTYTEVYVTILLVVNIFLLGTNLLFEPCLVSWVNHLRTIFFSGSLIATVATIIAAGLKNPDSLAPLIFMVVGWGLLIVLYPLLIFVLKKTRPGFGKNMEWRDRLAACLRIS